MIFKYKRFTYDAESFELTSIDIAPFWEWFKRITIVFQITHHQLEGKNASAYVQKRTNSHQYSFKYRNCHSFCRLCGKFLLMGFVYACSHSVVVFLSFSSFTFHLPCIHVCENDFFLLLMLLVMMLMMMVMVLAVESFFTTHSPLALFKSKIYRTIEVRISKCAQYSLNLLLTSRDVNIFSTCQRNLPPFFQSCLLF